MPKAPKLVERRPPGPKPLDQGHFKYLLRWQDGASDCWQTLRKLSHRPVAQKGATMPWKDKCEAADHAETPLAAYQDVARILHRVAEHLGKDPETLRIYDPYYCAGAVVSQLRGLGFLSVYNQPVDCYAAWEALELPEFDVLVTNPPYSGDHVAAWRGTSRLKIHSWTRKCSTLPFSGVSYCRIRNIGDQQRFTILVQAGLEVRVGEVGGCRFPGL
ncbi:unnamed protein product [Symbiodinium sp. CCMP2592]|nr:unnamed protein product [Symbiodinium sp. CCMP2592]